MVVYLFVTDGLVVQVAQVVRLFEKGPRTGLYFGPPLVSPRVLPGP